MGETELERVAVTPFVHQVGGHTCVLQVTPNVICVINISCDISNSCIKFYGEVPKGLARFIPETYEEEDTLTVIDHGIQDSDCKQGLRDWSDQCVRRQIDRYGYWSEGRSQSILNLYHQNTKPYRASVEF
uniref:Uncharacterized protein n=1 Tax=Magallana gigas TaxID=29159 RepID=K1R4T6_MAGGI